MSSFDSFAWDSDEHWLAYQSKLEIPSANKVALLRKRKQRWYKQNVDGNYEIQEEETVKPSKITEPDDEQSTTTNSSSTRSNSDSSTSQSNSFSCSTNQQQQQQQAYYAFPPDSQTSAPIRLTTLKDSILTYTQLALNLLILFSALCTVVPLLGVYQQQLCFKRVLHFALLHNALQVYKAFGLPIQFIWPYIRSWCQLIIQSQYIHYLFLSFMLQSLSGGTSIAVIPFALKSLIWLTPALQVVLPIKIPALNRLFAPHLIQLQQSSYQFERWCGLSEVLLGFVLLFNILTPQRNVLVLFLYFQYIRLRYIMSSHIRTAFTLIRQKFDYLLLQQRTVPLPVVVQRTYSKVCEFAWNLVDPQQLQQAQQQQQQGRCTIM